MGLNITKDGKTVFVSLGPANRVAVVDGQTYEVQKYLLVDSASGTAPSRQMRNTFS